MTRAELIQQALEKHRFFDEQIQRIMERTGKAPDGKRPFLQLS